MTSRYLDLPKPRLFGHRGFSAAYPENTLPAFRAALEAGARYLELDLWMTRDGQVVVHHDRNLRRTCGRFRRISALDLPQVRRLDAGYGFSPDGGGSYPYRGQGIGIPLLEEVLTTFPEAFLNLEIKQARPATEPELLAVLRRTGSTGRVLLASEKDAVMRRLRHLAPGIPTSFSQGEVARFLRWVQQGRGSRYRPPGVALQVPVTYGNTVIVTAETVAAAHAVGLEVHVWTVNEPQEMRRLLAMGVDGLMSDRPDLLVAVAEEKF
ncbi:MAG: glycerophosphodiester phosphodiesterase [Desulfuromonadales bacterium]|nr:glycerophosphodiester phosphodiesterase [Desulfuromonadales bacterium]